MARRVRHTPTMRRRLALLALLLAAACERTPPPAPAKGSPAPITAPIPVGAQDPGRSGLVVLNPAGPRATFRDFAKVQYGAQPEHTFKLRNDEPVAVTVLDLLPACGCLKARLRMRDEQ